MNPILANLELAEKLTPRELEICNTLVEGCTSEQIASRLGIKPHTVEVHRRNIFQKMGCDNIAQLVAKLFRAGILT